MEVIRIVLNVMIFCSAVALVCGMLRAWRRTEDDRSRHDTYTGD